MKKNIFTLMGILLCGVISYAQLNGEYSIDPDRPASNTNYQDIESAISDIEDGLRPDGGPANGWSMSGPVVFNIADGIYYQKLHIENIEGTSAEKTITFQSASGNPEDVKFIGVPDASNDAVLFLNSAKYMIFRNLTFSVDQTKYSNYWRTVYFYSASQHNRIENCTIIGKETTSQDVHHSAIYMYSSNVIENEIIGNRIYNGSVGIHNEHGVNNIIEGNVFKDQYHRGIYSYFNTSPRIINNTIITGEALERYGFYGIYCQYGYDSIQIIGNKLEGKFHLGILVQSNNHDNNRSTVANNMINITKKNAYSSAQYGIYLDRVSFVDVYFNTVQVNTGSREYAFYQYYLGSNYTGINIVNNIFATETGIPIYIGILNSIDTINNNNYYTEGTTLGSIYGLSTYANLELWKNATSMDETSVSIEPKFPGSGDLYFTNTALNNLGDISLVSLFPNDINGVQRNSLSCDIGALETELELEASLSISDSFPTPLCKGRQNFYVTVSNLGSSKIDSIAINWKFNDIMQEPVKWNGYLPSDSTLTLLVDEIDINSRNFKIMAEIKSINDGIDLIQDNNIDSLSLQTSLSGSYTIGGTNPDFSSFSEVAEVLSQYGICGPVLFNIREGVYYESLMLDEINGVNGTNTITFQSENQNAATVKISIPDHSVELFGTNFINFKHLTFEVKSNNEAFYASDVSYLTISNCRFTGNQVNSNQTAYSCIRFSDAGDSITISDNIFTKGSYGIYLSSLGGGSEKIHIINNKFINNYYTGIYLDNLKNPVVKDNYFRTNTEHNYFRGISLHQVDGNFMVLNNDISTNGIGIFVNYCDGYNNKNGIIANNQIVARNYGTPTDPSMGIKHLNSDYIQYLNNSIYVANPYYTDYAFYFDQGSNITIKNNNMVSQDGVVIYHLSEFPPSIIDYNNLFSPKGRIGYLEQVGYYVHSISELNANNGLYSHNISIDPGFVSDTNLHIVSGIGLNGMGDTIPEYLSTDIDGEFRDINNPDIGADEFDIQGTFDATVYKVFSNDFHPYCNETIDIDIILGNWSVIDLDSATIIWTVNGGNADTLKFTGPIKAGNDSIISLFQLYIENDKYYDVDVKIVDANGVQDNNPNNDEYSIRFYGGLSGGTYTIGGLNADYDDITSATNQIIHGGLCGGDVIFNIRDGVYDEQVKISNVFHSFPQPSITFQSESGDSSAVIWKYTATNPHENYILKLSDLEDVTIQHLTMQSEGNKYNQVLELDKCRGIKIIGNQFIAPGTGTEDQLYDDQLLGTITTSNSVVYDSCLIQNNIIKGGYYGIAVKSVNPDEGIVISNNIIRSKNGINVSNATNACISKNSIEAENNGIVLYYMTDELIVSDNQILLSGQSNYIAKGISLNRYNNYNDSRGIIKNNIISSSRQTEMHGIYIYNSQRINIYHNSVRIIGKNDNATAFYSGSNTSTNLMNNIFANYGEGYAVQFSVAPDSVDYNCYFNSGNYLAKIENINYPSLKNWLYHHPGTDANSVNEDPYFISEIHLSPTNQNLSDMGTSIAAVPVDIFGKNRDNSPSLGAIEFDIAGLDAGIIGFVFEDKYFCNGLYPVSAIIRNHGTSSISSAKIDWKIDNIAQTSVNWTGNLASGETDTVLLGNFSVDSGSDNEISINMEASTSMPSNSDDEKPENDSYSKVLHSGLKGTYIIGTSANANFKSFSEAVDFIIQSEAICAPIEFVVESGIYHEYLRLPEIVGTSANNTITFRSATGNAEDVVLRYDRNTGIDAVLLFDGGDHYVFKNISIEHSSVFDNVIEFKNGALDNKFENCHLHKYDENENIVYSNDSKNNNSRNSFIGNTFNGGETSINWVGWKDRDELENMLEIRNNRFINSSNYAVLAEGVDSLIFTGNTVEVSINNSNYNSGMYLDNDDNINYFDISNNQFLLNSGENAIAIYSYVGNGASYNKIANNYINISNSNATDPVNGIYCEAAKVDIVHNTIVVESATSNSYGLLTYDAYGTNIVNNLIYCLNNAIPFNYDYPESAMGMVDYNLYFSIGGKIGVFDSFNSFEDYKTITGFDVNSLNVNPELIDEGPYFCNAQVDGSGILLPNYKQDLFGYERNSTATDIGAVVNTNLNDLPLEDELFLCEGETIALDAGPSGGTYKWSTGETTQSITVSDEGTYSVTLTSDCGSSSKDMTVSFKTDCTTSISEDDHNSTEGSIMIYPNPSDGHFFIKADIQEEINTIIKIYSMMGQLVYSTILDQYSGIPVEVDISDQPSGIYSIQLLLNDKTYNKMIAIE